MSNLNDTLLQIMKQIVISQQSALERMGSKLDEACSKLREAERKIQQPSSQRSYELSSFDYGVPAAVSDDDPRDGTGIGESDIADAPATLALTTMPTSAIANARDRSMTPFSSGPTRSSVPSSSARNILLPPNNLSATSHESIAAIQYAPPRPPAGSLDHPGSYMIRIGSGTEMEVEDGLSLSLSKDQSPLEDKPQERPGRSQSAIPHCTPPNLRYKDAPAFSAEPSALPEVRDAQIPASGATSESPTSCRRSVRSQAGRPDSYFAFADPTHPSYLGPIAKKSNPARTRRQKASEERTRQATALRDYVL